MPAALRSLSLLDKLISEKSYLLYSLDDSQIIVKKNELKYYHPASTIKILYGLEVSDRLFHGRIKNTPILIDKKYLFNEGTNILRDLSLETSGEIRLSIKTLTRLMLKHSCNGSTAVILDIIAKNLDLFESHVKKRWLPEGALFNNFGKMSTLMNCTDILNLYKHIYENKTIPSDSVNFLQSCLKEGKSRYSVFDQKGLGIEILGCKGGQLYDFETKRAYYHASGVFLVKRTGKKYIVVTMTKGLDLYRARSWTRDIGKWLLSLVR